MSTNVQNLCLFSASLNFRDSYWEASLRGCSAPLVFKCIFELPSQLPRANSNANHSATPASPSEQSQRPTTPNSEHCQRTASSHMRLPTNFMVVPSRSMNRTLPVSRCKSNCTSPHPLSSHSPSRKRISNARLGKRYSFVVICDRVLRRKRRHGIAKARARPSEAPRAAREVPALICSARRSRDGIFTSITARMPRTSGQDKWGSVDVQHWLSTSVQSSPSCSLRSRLGIIMRACLLLDARNHFFERFPT